MYKNSICVFGAASDTIDKDYILAGEELGRMMADRNIRLVFGGGSTGLMGAVVRGIAEKDGESLGIAPHFFDKSILFNDCTEFIRTETMRVRKQTMEDNADAFIMTAGGIGTFEEFFEILTLKTLGQTDKKIGILNTKGYYDSLIGLIRHSIDNNFAKENVMDAIIVGSTPQELLDKMGF